MKLKRLSGVYYLLSEEEIKAVNWVLSKTSNKVYQLINRPAVDGEYKILFSSTELEGCILISKEEIESKLGVFAPKTDVQCLYDNGIDIGKHQDDFNTSMMYAMRQYVEHSVPALLNHFLTFYKDDNNLSKSEIISNYINSGGIPEISTLTTPDAEWNITGEIKEGKFIIKEITNIN